MDKDLEEIADLKTNEEFNTYLQDFSKKFPKLFYVPIAVFKHSKSYSRKCYDSLGY